MATLAELDSRYARIRAGLDVGFAEVEASCAFRATHGGVWMTVEDRVAAREALATAVDPKTVLPLSVDGSLPFEDHQFEVLLIGRAMFDGARARVETLVREAHRVLQGGGCLLFTVEEASKDGRGWSQRSVYELLRAGFDVVGLRRPPWWKFGSAGRLMTVCAQRKSWRNAGASIVSASVPVSSAMLSPRMHGKH